jgi:hypothetical protein
MDIFHKPLRPLTSVEVKKFWQKVAVGSESECWLWKGALYDTGYGKFFLQDSDGTWDKFRAHRVSYFIIHGEDPAEYQVIHRCDNPPCVNPAHLRKATNYDNVQDMIAKGRNPHGDKHWARRMPDRVLRGGRNGAAKLTEAVVRAIRSRWDNREKEPISMYRLSKEYQISASHVKNIIDRIAWAHV